jgi:Cytochrome P460
MHRLNYIAARHSRRLRTGGKMKKRLLVLGFLLPGVSLPFFSPPADQPQSVAPQFAPDGKLVRPQGYRKWVYVSSGYGMSYTQSPSGMQTFTNVFVTPAAYDYFEANGKWPDKTMFVLEIYGSTSRGSINKHGSYQTDFVGLDVEVKDESRFADKWAYFNFSETAKAAPADTPSKNDCWKCHEQNAAVEHSFVQFYPELLKIARTKGTIKPGLRLDE